MKNQNILFLVSIFQILCLNINAQTKGDSLIVFVGELISIKYIPVIDIRTEIRDGDTIQIEIPQFNSKYKSKFKVIKKLNGFYNQDTIEFMSYVHSDYPPGFSKYKHSLLFISQYGKELIQQKYTYFPVYKTKNGRWASDYRYGDYQRPFKNDFTVHPESIEFEKELSFDISNMDKTFVEQRFPKEYYNFKDEKAIAKFGNYIEELFELKKQGYLKARGLF